MQLDIYSLAEFIRGQDNRRKRRRLNEKQEEESDLRPITFVRFNARRGKAKPVTLKALLDSGGGGSLVAAKFAKKLKIRKLQRTAQVWTTPSGNMTTSSKVKAQFTMPELHDKRLGPMT